MAQKTATKKKPEKSFEATLWDTANSLRGKVEPSEYQHVVLGLDNVFYLPENCRWDYIMERAKQDDIPPQTELRSLFAEETEVRREEKKVFKTLSYEI